MTSPAVCERHRRIVAGESAARAAPSTTVIRAAGLALRELLADAQDRPQARVERPAELAADQLVGLARVASPLGVADDDPGREPDQHRRRDLAGVRAGQLVVDVLGADADVRVRVGERVADHRQAARTAGRSPG